MTDKRNFNENEDKSLPKEEGLIIKATGGFYYVLCGEETYECRARGVFRKREQSPLVGDRVTVSVLPNEKGYIYAIHERKNSLVRPPLANIDQLVMVVSVAEPAPNLLVMDKLIAVAEHQDVEPVLVFTKCDLADPAPYAEIYRKAGFRVYEVCSTEHRGTGAVLEMLRGRVSAFCGNSGVGKSTLLNALLPEAERETSAISQKLGRGRHTTREVTIFEAFGGRIADTPGFASLEANRAGFIPKENLEHAFPEFGPYLGQCQFTGCSHRTEKGCAIRAALAEGKLSRTRYDSYCAMYEEVKDVKNWQRRGM